ncbi:MAG TPA: hypothetical protein VEP73_04445, partial [Actinomycetota bacterium]|nr:hypothetical protein [Actinomycetota bacterium]
MRRKVSLLVGVSLMALLVAAPAASARSNAAGSAKAGGLFGSRAQMVRYVRTHGYIPIGGPAAYARYSAAAAQRAAALHPGTYRGPVGTAPVASPSWQGVDENDLAPPDPTGAIGTKSYV